MAAMQNKAGTIVTASIQSAQSAVRSSANTLLFKSACPGFGMCADVSDADDYDVWPITAITVKTVKRGCIEISLQSLHFI